MDTSSCACMYVRVRMYVCMCGCVVKCVNKIGLAAWMYFVLDSVLGSLDLAITRLNVCVCVCVCVCM